MNTEQNETESPIDVYLDQLVAAMSKHHPRQLRSLLTEAESHLRDDAEAAQARGMSAQEAEVQAVERFGPAGVIAEADRAHTVTPVRVLLRQVLGSALLLGGIGGVAIGASGILAGILRLTAGSRFLAAPAPAKPSRHRIAHGGWASTRPPAPAEPRPQRTGPTRPSTTASR